MSLSFTTLSVIVICEDDYLHQGSHSRRFKRRMKMNLSITCRNFVRVLSCCYRVFWHGLNLTSITPCHNHLQKEYLLMQKNADESVVFYVLSWYIMWSKKRRCGSKSTTQHNDFDDLAVPRNSKLYNILLNNEMIIFIVLK